MIRRLHDRKDFSKNEHIIQKDVFHMRFVTVNFSEKKSEAVNIMKTEQISLKIKRCKKFKTRLNMKSKNHKKTSTKYSVSDTRKHSLSKC